MLGTASVRFTVMILVAGIVFATTWWCCEAGFGLERETAQALAGLAAALACGPLAWWAGRDRPITVAAAGDPAPDSLPAWNVEPRNRGFTGREQVLSDLRDRLCTGGTAVVQALRGLGGVGKTQAAIEYAHRYSASYRVVWWITAEDPDLIGEQVVALAVTLGLTTRDVDGTAAAELVKSHLRARPDWLLVFDNANDPGEVAKWLPGGAGHVIITSRVRGWEHLAESVDLDVMNRRESVLLLQRRHTAINDVDSVRLAEALGDLPLALAQAAAFLAASGTGVEEYLRLLDAHAGEVMDEGETDAYPRTLAAAITIATDALGGHDRPALALLQICSFLAPETIPVEWFTNPHFVDEPGNEELGTSMAVRRSVAHLAHLSLATATGDGIKVHRITQAVIRDRLPVPDQERMRTRTQALLAANNPTDPDHPMTWPRWARILPHLFTVDPTHSENPDLRTLAGQAGRYLLVRGEPEPAFRLASRLHTEWTAALGSDHLDTLAAASNLANALSAQGHYQQARRLHEDTLLRRREVLGADHHDTLTSADDLAWAQYVSEDYPAARRLCQDTLARCQRVLGDDHATTLRSASNLANALFMLGEPEAAHHLHEATLGRRRRVLGDDHPDTLWSASCLAAVKVALGDLEAARQLSEDTLARYERGLGKDHPATLTAANTLCATLSALGVHHRLRVLAEDTYSRCRRVLGADHRDTGRSRAYLALAEVNTTPGRTTGRI